MTKQRVKVLDPMRAQSALGGDHQEGDVVSVEVSTTPTIDPSVLQGLVNTGAVELLSEKKSEEA